MPSTRVFVALSGGVDSSVSALLLKERGFEVCGVHIKMWSDPDIPCTLKEDRIDAMRAAAALDIPFQTWDLTEEYRRAVVEYLIREYAAGRTPNPDIRCNRDIKFGAFFNRAIDAGADVIATGHYARVVSPSAPDGIKPRYALAAGHDSAKDQSYFLWTLGQRELSRTLFPIGEYSKSEVRERARAAGLPNADKPDSQGICFIGEIDISKFLERHIPETPGPVRTADGRWVGTHRGTPFYTLGQRKGLGIGGGVPYYVAAKDLATNTVVVGTGPYDHLLFGPELETESVHWISGAAPSLPLRCQARIRYRQPLQAFMIEEVENQGVGIVQSVRVVFDAPQRAITPGQSVVFYRGSEVLGGGVIV